MRIGGPSKINPGNGWRLSRLILNAKTTDEAEALFRDFMAQPHRDREERVFAAYWLKTCKLRGVTLQDSWQKMAFAAAEHEHKVKDSGFWGRTIPEAGALQREVYPEETEE